MIDQSDYVKLASNYSITYNDALDRYCSCGIADEEHRKELECELNYVIKKVKEHLHYAGKHSMIDTVKRLEKELEKLQNFLDEVTNGN